MKEEILKKISSLEDELKKLKEQVAKDDEFPKDGDYYYPKFRQNYEMWNNDECDNFILKLGLICKNKEEQQKANEIREKQVKIIRRISELNKEHGWVCDFNNKIQQKKFFIIDDKNKIYASYAYSYKHLPTEFHFKPGLDDQLIEEFGDDLRVLFMWV